MNKLVYSSLQTNCLVCPVKSVICVSEKSGVCAGLFNEIEMPVPVLVLVLVDGLIRSKVYENASEPNACLNSPARRFIPGIN